MVFVKTEKNIYVAFAGEKRQRFAKKNICVRDISCHRNSLLAFAVLDRA
jgi:hypothetical protein